MVRYIQFDSKLVQRVEVCMVVSGICGIILRLKRIGSSLCIRYAYSRKRCS